MRISTIVLSVFGTLLAASGSASPWTVSERGFGPVHFGMTVEEAQRLIGVKLQQDGYNDNDQCRYFTPVSGFAGLSFMTTDRTIVRVDAFRGGIATDKGAKVGDTEKRVFDLYGGRVSVAPHFYGGLPSRYLRVKDSNGKTQLLFETDGKVVTSYRAGHEPEVEYVEGCQ
jgi:hypothetical protein